jgi:hypothetical protein
MRSDLEALLSVFLHDPWEGTPSHRLRYGRRVTSPEKRILLEKTMRSVMDRFAAKFGKDAVFTNRYRAGDESEYDELVREACAESGVDYDDYVSTVESDAQLSDLHKRSITEILLGPVGRSRDSAKKLPEAD